MKNFDFIGFRADFKKAVKELEGKYNVDLSIGNITYDLFSFSTKLSVTSLDAGGSKEEVDFETNCKYYGYAETDYKRKIHLNKGSGEFVGFIPRGKTYKYLVRQGEKVYKVAEIKFII